MGSVTANIFSSVNRAVWTGSVLWTGNAKNLPARQAIGADLEGKARFMGQPGDIGFSEMEGGPVGVGHDAVFLAVALGKAICGGEKDGEKEHPQMRQALVG
jgi:hypothetical protein